MRIFQTIERLAERQVANDIESRPIEPVGEVDPAFCGAVDLFLQPGNEVIDVALNKGFLLPKCLVGESMAEKTAHAAVVGVGRSDNALDTGEQAEVFLKVLVAGAVAVKVFPGGGADERELIRGDADDVAAVVIVEVLEPMGKATIPGDHGYGDFGCGCKAGAGEFGEGMEPDVVDCFHEGIEYDPRACKPSSEDGKRSDLLWS